MSLEAATKSGLFWSLKPTACVRMVWYLAAQSLARTRSEKLMNFAGMDYPQRYAWFLHFNDKGIIYEVRFSPILSEVDSQSTYRSNVLTLNRLGQSIPRLGSCAKVRRCQLLSMVIVVYISRKCQSIYHTTGTANIRTLPFLTRAFAQFDLLAMQPR
jgi:hypothetical protein